MAKQPKIAGRIISAISNRGLLVIIASVLLITLLYIALAYRFILPTPPDTLVMTTGFERGGFATFGERYRQILAREKIHLELLTSSGSVQNLRRLNDKFSQVDAGFVQCCTRDEGRPLEVGLQGLASNHLKLHGLNALW